MRLCAQAGKDIFCEKPFTLTVEEADQILDLTAKAGVRVQVGHVRRYDPPNVKAKKSIDILIFRFDWKELENALKVASGRGVASCRRAMRASRCASRSESSQ